MNKKWKQENYDKLKSRVNLEDVKYALTVGYTRVKNEVLHSADMPTTYRIVYMTLESFCYGDKTECFPSNSTIAYLVGKSVRTVQRAIHYLKENGFIEVVHRTGTSNLFTVLKKVITEKKDKEKFYKKIKSKKKNEPEQYGATKFSNFEPREYDYGALERKLLGQDNS